MEKVKIRYVLENTGDREMILGNIRRIMAANPKPSVITVTFSEYQDETIYEAP